MSAQKKSTGYNKGDRYEDKIANILIDKKILPNGYKRAGASDKADIEINFKGKKIKIEVFNILKIYIHNVKKQLFRQVGGGGRDRTDDL